MKSERMRPLFWAVAIGIAACLVLVGVFGLSPAQAHDLEPVVQRPEPTLDFSVVFTDPAIYNQTVEIIDLSGNVVGEGTHWGEVKCRGDNCNHKTMLTLGLPLMEPVAYEYKFTTILGVDLVGERVLVAGIGTISSDTQKERFSFTAVFENNRDGTVSTTYEASIPDASFVVPNTPGNYIIRTTR